MLRAIHGRSPRLLAEDFSGSAAVSREWLATDPRASAIVTDLDRAALARARGIGRLTIRRADVLRSPPRTPCDAIYVGNFSIGEIHERAALVAYLRRCRARLRPRGVFVCDLYGGQSAFRPGSFHRTHPGPDGTCIHYTWQQVFADPLTGLVENAMHFRVTRRARTITRHRNAFTYHWRLWPIPELRDAMLEAGFRTVEVYDRAPDAIDHKGNAYAHPLQADEMPTDWIVLVAARR